MPPAAPLKGEHQNIARVRAILDALERSQGGGLRLVDVVEATGLGTGPVHRLLSGLEQHGFVDHDAEKGRYHLGLQMLRWAFAASDRYGLAPFVEPSLERLAKLTQDTVYFCLLSRGQSLCVDRREGDFPVRTLTIGIGESYPLGLGAASLALLAFQPEEEIPRILDEQAEARAGFAVPQAQIEAAVADARARGVALVEGQIIEGMTGIGIPIIRGDGRAIASISIAAMSARLSGDRQAQVIGWLHEEVAAIRARAGDTLDRTFVRRRGASHRAG